MVKPEKVKKISAEASTSDTSSKYTGVRKRKWGKYVSEIRLPNCRDRIWLGSYDTAEKAAKAFDAALFCIRGPSAKFNFPDNPPYIPGGQSLQPSEIQAVAARYANSVAQSNDSFREPSTTSSSSSYEMRVDSPSQSVSDGTAQVAADTTLDGSFLDHFSTLGSDYNVTSSYGMYPGFHDFSNDFYVPPPPIVDDFSNDFYVPPPPIVDDFSNDYYVPPPPIVDYYPEEQYDGGYSHYSLWNF